MVLEEVKEEVEEAEGFVAEEALRVLALLVHQLIVSALIVK